MGVETSITVFEYYRYTPSIVACIIFIFLFSATTTLHVYQLARTRAWIMLPLVIGGFFEVFGYITRIFSSKQTPNYSLPVFLMQGAPTLLAPALFAASIYMCLGRIIRATDAEHLSLIRTSRITKIFVAGDVMGLLIQGTGASVMPLGTLKDYYMGSNIVIASLAILVSSFALFIVVALIFDIRLRRQANHRSLNTSLDWTLDLRALYLSSFLIFVRSIFRLVEYSQGNDGWAMHREWTLYLFDATLMWGVLFLFNVYHPSHVTALLNGGMYSERLGLKIVEVRLENSGIVVASKLTSP